MKVCDADRRDLRAKLAATGKVPPQHLDEIVDIAAHAAESAFATLQRLALDTHPDGRVGICAMGPALGLLGGMVLAGTAGLHEFAQKNGLYSATMSVGGGQ